MPRIVLITGAGGNLGSALAVAMLHKGETVRTLLMEGQAPIPGADNFYGDVRYIDTLRPCFEHSSTDQLVVIHAAGIISIEEQVSPLVESVNVGGVKNIIALCREYQVARLLYISSVHAIFSQEPVIHEVDVFDPQLVEGAYAKSKAQATQLVLESGLDVVVLHPSGILVPGTGPNNNLNELVHDFLFHKLHAICPGGYDIVDQRDVVDGIIAAVDAGRAGNCYILCGGYVSIRDLLDKTAQLTGQKKIQRILSAKFLLGVSKLCELYYRIRGKQPLFTRYSIQTISQRQEFSCEKARKELGYHARPLEETLREVVAAYGKLPPQQR